MAFLVAEPIALTPTTTAAANYPITISSLGLTLVNDDWLILSVACAATSGTLSTASSGWTEIAELGVTSGNRMARYKAKVASGTVGDVQIDLSAGTGQWSGSIEQWRDADATDCIDSSAGSAGSSGGAVISEVSGELNSGGINKPNTDNCAISYFSSSRLSGVGTALRFKPDEVVGRLIQSADDGTVYRSIAIGTAQQTTAAATAKTVYVEKSSRIGSITVAIKNKTNGGTERDCRAGVEKMAWLGTFGTTHESLGTTWGAPSTFVNWTGGTIGGITADTNAPTISNDQVVGGLAWGAWTSVSSNVNTAGAIVGGWIALPATINLTGKFVSLEWFQSLLGALFGAEGVFLALGDNATASTGNAVVYRLAPKLAVIQNKVNTSIIDPATAATFDTEGSINLATINKVGFFYHRVGSSASARVILVRNLLAIANSILTGGSAGKPLDIRFLDAALNGWGYTGLCEKQGDAVLVKTDVQFGNGTIPTYVDTTATLLNTPSAYSTGTQPFWNAAANSITVGMKAASGDTMNFIASAMAAGAGAEQNFTIDPATSASALAYSFQGEVISNFLFTGDTDVPISGATYSGCDTVAFGGADATNVTITDTTSTNAAASWDADGGSATSCTIDGTGAAYAIELGTAVTAITLTDCDITAGSTNKVHVLATTGTVIITISGMTVLDVGSVTSEGATVQVDAPVVTADISITGMPIAGTDIWLQIINTTALSAASRANSTAYSAGDIRLRQTGIGTEQTAGLYLRCTTSGTSAGTPPTWNTTVGGTTTDGTVVWTTYAVLYFHADPASATLTDTYIDGEEFLAGETVDIRFAEMNAGTSFKRYSTTVLAETTGFSALVTEEADDVYATNALDGSAYETTFSPDFTNDYIVLDTNTDFAGKAAYAYFCYTLTTDAGMWNFWGGVTALDVGNYRINTAILDLYFDESAGFVKQTDDVRIFRDNGTRPAIDPTTGGHGIEINWRTPVSVVSTGGSAVLPQDIVDIAAASAAAVVADGKTLTVPKFLGLK